MMKMLENWSITVDPTKSPPKTFVEEQENHANLNQKLNLILKTLKGRAITCLIFPSKISCMERESINYSMMRELSQSSHKPRMFKDM
jgi:hypothetical protein